jgi:hypothetical protein
MGADLLRRHPGQVFTEALPQMIVAAVRDRLPRSVAQQLPLDRGVALAGVVRKVRHQCG